MTELVEVWRQIPGHPYEASNLGRVRNMRNKRPITAHLHNGYLRVDLGRSGKKFVHVAVLEAFVGPCPPGCEGRHVHDRTRTNCNLWNLAWGTRAQNVQDKVEHGTSGRWVDLTGQEFGRLRVVGLSPVPSKNAKWLCRCECGNEHTVRGDTLVRGGSRSCGCLKLSGNHCGNSLVPTARHRPKS